MSMEGVNVILTLLNNRKIYEQMSLAERRRMRCLLLGAGVPLKPGKNGKIHIETDLSSEDPEQ